MEVLYGLPYYVLQEPNVKIKKPSFIKAPSSTLVFAVILVSYFLVTGGVIYDVIVEPPSIGSTTDEFGHSKPVAFMQYRVNGQYIMEGLASSFLFSLGAIGFIVLEQSDSSSLSRFNRIMLISFGFVCVVISFFACRIFMTMKLPGYLR